MDLESITSTIALQVRRRRQNLSLSVADLAAKIGMTSDELAAVEQAATRIRAVDVLGLSSALGVPASALFVKED